jgi:hypothetical protein
MANKFWVGGTGTWDTTTTTHWATSTGGAGGTAVPTTGDAVTFDGSSGGGTVTVAALVSGLSLASLTCGAFTGTLDLATNQPINLTFTGGTGLSVTGTGARTLNFGTGTYTFTTPGGSNNPVDATTITNLTNPTTAFASSAIVFNSSGAGQQQLIGGGLTYGTVTVNSRTNGMTFLVGSANSFSNFTVNGPCDCTFPASLTNTITGSLTITGTSSGLVKFTNGNVNSATVATLAVTGATLSATWGVFKAITLTGATMTATNSYDLGANTGITITGPSGGAAGVIGS